MLSPSRPLFLLGAHKAGTSLLRALFDGHPDLCVLPVETHPFAHLGYWIRNPYRAARPASAEREAVLERMIGWIATCDAAHDRMGDSVVTGQADLQAARIHLDATLHDAPAEAVGATLQSYFEAVALAFGMDAQGEQRIVEKSVEHAEFVLDLAAAFPAADFVHIVRNPYANLVSLRKYKATTGRGTFPWIGPAVETLVQHVYHLARNRRLVPRYHVVRYEDLVAAPRATMETLCQDLSVSFQQSLLVPTALGRPWKGNSSSARALDGIAPDRIQAWQREITPLEVALINRHLAEVLDAYGYDCIKPSGRIYRRIQGEPLRHYFANRLIYRAP